MVQLAGVYPQTVDSTKIEKLPNPYNGMRETLHPKGENPELIARRGDDSEWVVKP